LKGEHTDSCEANSSGASGSMEVAGMNFSTPSICIVLGTSISQVMVTQKHLVL